MYQAPGSQQQTRPDHYCETRSRRGDSQKCVYENQSRPSAPSLGFGPDGSYYGERQRTRLSCRRSGYYSTLHHPVSVAAAAAARTRTRTHAERLCMYHRFRFSLMTHRSLTPLPLSDPQLVEMEKDKKKKKTHTQFLNRWSKATAGEDVDTIRTHCDPCARAQKHSRAKASPLASHIE